MRIASFYLGFFADSGIGYCILSIVQAMESDSIKGSIMGVASDKKFYNKLYRSAIPPLLNPIVYRLLSEETMNKIAEKRYFNSFDNQDFAYFWTQGISYELYEKIHSRGGRIIYEMVNTTEAYRKQVLDAEYLRLGLPPTHGMTEEKVESEKRKFELVDFVYCCSPEVENSLRLSKVPGEKILQTSYGLRESDILPISDIEARKSRSEFTIIFVGAIGVRKAAHLLLDYWCEAKVQGKLKLVGNIEDEVKPLIEPYLRREDVEHVPFVKDLREIYKEADLFALPSLEEGSPLVTYLALGAGLPALVSPMGAGGIVKHGENGLVLDPYDKESWIEALQQLAEDVGLREKLSMCAYQKAPDYLWSNVGRRRSELLLSKLNR